MFEWSRRGVAAEIIIHPLSNATPGQACLQMPTAYTKQAAGAQVIRAQVDL
jgi:hypothetical protein